MMIEKTFIDKLSYGSKTDGMTEARRAAIKMNSLNQKRTQTLAHLALCLGEKLEFIQIVEGLDTWASNKGRYSGEALNLRTNKNYSFISQSFDKSSTEIFTNIIIKELASNIK